MPTIVTQPLQGSPATAPPRPARRTAQPTVVERDPRRDRRHLLMAGLAWGVGAVGWVVAARGSSQRHFVLALIVVAASLGLCTVVTAAWVAHNRSIHRRKGPRTGLPTARVDYATDWVGRPVTTEWSLVQLAPEVVISVGGEWKAVWPAKGRVAGPRTDPR